MMVTASSSRVHPLHPILSFPRRREPSTLTYPQETRRQRVRIPALAGMTGWSW